MTNDNDNGNDNRTPAAAAMKGSTALTSLAALGLALNNVNTSAITGRSGTLLLFKSREGGKWVFGTQQTIVEEGSRWAVNPLTFQWGYICFGPDKKRLGERLVSVGQPMPDVTTLPDLGADWQAEWAVGLKCTDGTDAGIEVIFKTPTVGGNQAVAELIDAVRARVNSGQHEVSPIVHLENYSYPHGQYGRTFNPVFTIIDWMSLDGPASVSAPPPSPPPASEQPRRRRVG